MRALTLFIIGILIFGWPTSTPAQTTSEVFSRVKPSIAIIARKTATGISTGTGFCIASTDKASFYLTNAHVVGNDEAVTVIRQFPKLKELFGTVVARGEAAGVDLAVIRVSQANIPALRLRRDENEAGAPVAVAGYPRSQYDLKDLSGDLTPSIHLGTISAVVNRGAVIEYDAITEPGNSGGPLINPSTGDVLGVVRAKLGEHETNLAIGISRVVIPFLKLNGIAFIPTSAVQATKAADATNAQPSEQEILRVLPGAGNVAVFYQGQADPTASREVAENARDFALKFAAKFNIRVVLVKSLASFNDVASAAHEAGALIGIYYDNTWRLIADRSNAYGISKTWAFGAQMVLVDGYGYQWFNFSKTKNALTGRDDYSAVISSEADLNDKLIAAMTEVATDPSATTNLFRYALLMPNGGRRVFVSLSSDPTGGKVFNIASFSPAIEAGLQIGDIVLSINGIRLAGKTNDDLLDVLRAQVSGGVGALDFKVLGADGKQATIRFSSHDVRWYVDHRGQLPI